MSNPPPSASPPVASYAPRNQVAVDGEHLRMLAICHYIWAGLLVPFACFGLIYVGLGVAMIAGKMQSNTMVPMTVVPSAGTTLPTAVPLMTPNNTGDQIVGYFFVAFGGAFVVLGLALAICTLLAGRSLSKRRRRVFVLVVAVLNCLMFPIGTALGVFTLIVVLRESVRQLFDPTNRVAEAA